MSRATVIRLADVLQNARRSYLVPATVDPAKTVRQMFPEMTVRHGPFAGLRYPDAKATGSLLFPKLLGSYERELHDVIESICGERFTTVLDIGCAEGYYAVGLARRMPQVEVHAFDISAEAQRLCTAMAAANDVSGRVHVQGRCDPATLRSLLQSKEKVLVIADCEGYELDLFTPEVISAGRTHTFLVETHDLLNLHISPTLKSRFAATHHLTSIKSIDDIHKVHEYDYPELNGFSLEARRELLGEFRGSIMEWLLFAPRASATSA